ncbi:MAG: chemotaxis protein CheW [Oscillospiraceae bacterium]
MSGLSAITAGIEDAQRGRYLTFLIGSQTYGLEIRYVTEIIGMQPLTVMPEMPFYFKGIINLRGIVIPLMDVRLRFGKQEREYDDRTCVIVINFFDIFIGLIVDSVSEVLTIADENVLELPKSMSGNRYLKNLGKSGDDVILLLDCEKLLMETEI